MTTSSLEPYESYYFVDFPPKGGVFTCKYAGQMRTNYMALFPALYQLYGLVLHPPPKGLLMRKKRKKKLNGTELNDNNFVKLFYGIEESRREIAINELRITRSHHYLFVVADWGVTFPVVLFDLRVLNGPMLKWLSMLSLLPQISCSATVKLSERHLLPRTLMLEIRIRQWTSVAILKTWK